jgi:heavy metal sensor kinase
MFAWFVALASFLVCAMSAAFYIETRRTLLDSLDAELHLRAQEVHKGLESGRSPAELVSQVGDERRMRGVAILSLSGAADVARSGSLDRFAEAFPGERLANLAAQPRRRRAETVDAGTGGRLRVAAKVYGRKSGADRARIIAVSESVAGVEEELREVLAGFAVTLPVALGLACLGAWLTARHLTRPLREIAAATERIEFGDAQVAIPGSGGHDEVARLAAALERTFVRLTEAYARQERFSADAAHELRTPVSIVISQAEVALRRERTPPEYREALQHVLGAARRMQETVDSLLLLARGGAGELSVQGARADLADVCRRLLPGLEAQGAGRGVAIALENADGSVVAGDAALLAVLVRNVAVNAVDHSPPQSTVRIGIAGAPGEVVLRVRDQGPGIPAEVRERVFDRFFRADDSRSRATGGSGLGLSIVRLIAEIHGGTARVVDADGPGACVEVRLPRAAAVP